MTQIKAVVKIKEKRIFFMKAFLFLTILLGFVSCDVEEKVESDLVSAQDNLNTNDNRNFKVSEEKNLKNICKALEEKQDRFERAIGVKYSFNFQVSTVNCDTLTKNYNHSVYTTAPASGEIKFYPQSGSEKDEFNYSIYTSSHKSLSVICDAVLSPNDANQVDRKIIQLHEDNSYYRYNVFAENAFEYYIYTKNNSGNFKISSFEKIVVDTNPFSNHYGMLLERITGRFCSGSTQSYFKQILK